MESVFLTASLSQLVDETHASFVPVPAVDLLDFVITPHDRFPALLNDPSVRQTVRALMLIPNTGKFNQWDMYTLVECHYMESRYKMIRSIAKSDFYLLTKPLTQVTVSDLEVLSKYAKGAMQAFWIKHAAIQLGFIKDYKGVMPNTKPVASMTKILLGVNLNQEKHTDFCLKFAQEMGTYPAYVNTALWIMGRRLPV